MAQQLTMQDLVDYRAFLELQRDNWIINPKAEKKRQIKNSLKRQIEIDKKQAQARKRKK